MRFNNKTFILLIILSVLALGLFSFFGITQSLWHDEALSIYFAEGNFSDIVNRLIADNNFPLYYLILTIWINLFGISEFAVRSLSVVFYVLGLFALHSLTRRFHDKKTSLLCLFLYIVNPFVIPYIQIARTYTLLILLTILAILFFTKIFLDNNHSPKNLTLYTIINILGTFTHPWFIFVVLSQIIGCILLSPKKFLKTFLPLIFLSLAPFIIFWLPIVFSQIGGGASSWIAREGKPNIYSLIYFFCHIAIGQKIDLNLEKTIFSAALIYTIFFLIVFIKKVNFTGLRSDVQFLELSALKKFAAEKQNLMLLIFAVTPLAASFIVSQIKPIFMERYAIIIIIPLIILAGKLLTLKGKWPVILIICYVFLSLSTFDFVKTKTAHQGCSAKDEMKFLIAHAAKNDIIIFTSLSRPVIDYYLRRFNKEKNFIKFSYPRELLTHPGWRDVDRMLSKKNLLKEEAKNLAEEIDTFLIDNPRQKIWLFYGFDLEINAPLKETFDKYFTLEKTFLCKPNWKVFYSMILVYRKQF